MITIGLTGGIASGKSTVAKYLLEQGAVIIDADQLARELVIPGQPALQEIKEVFGGQVIQPDGTLNRKCLGEIIFSDAAKKEQLNKIMSDRIYDRIVKLLTYYSKVEAEVVVVDVPLLYEGGMTNIVDYVWVVYVPAEIQIKRLIKRDGITEEQAKKRLLSQMPIEEKKVLADKVIDNTKSIEHTYRQVFEYWHELKHKM